MTLNIFKIIKNHLEYKKLVKCMNEKGMEFPAICTKWNQLILKGNNYVGPDSWISIRGDAKVIIGKNSIIGPRLKVHTANHNYQGEMLPYDDKYLVQDVEIGDNVWVGADVTLLPGVKVGEGAVIAACSVVTGEIPPLAIVGGVPAKVIKYRDKDKYYKLVAENKFYIKLKKEGKTILNDNDRCINISKKN